MNNAVTQPPDRPSPYVGQVGSRMTLELTLNEVRSPRHATDYFRIYKFTDAAGRRFVWLSSSGLNSWHQGHTFELRATIKKHGEFRGLCETEITRVAIVRQLSQAHAPVAMIPLNLIEVPVEVPATSHCPPNTIQQ